MPKITENKINILKRLPFFKNCTMFINISYDVFKKDLDGSLKQINSPDFIDSEKEYIQMASKHLSEIKKADPELRDTFMNSNDEISNLSKVMISNSLLFNKIKKFKESRKENEYMKLFINLEKYHSEFPLIEISK